MTKVKVTHIELKMEIGTGWAKTVREPDGALQTMTIDIEDNGNE